MNIVIVGGVAGGAACAARLRRLSESARIIMIDKGHYVSFANCGLPYYLSGTIAERQSLFVSNQETFERNFKVEVHLDTEVKAIDRAQRKISLQSTSGTTELAYDLLILSPGSSPIVPPFAAALPHVYTLRNVPDVDAIKAELNNGGFKRALVVGGGFIGLECAENLREDGLEVTLAEAAAQVLPPLDFDMAQYVHLKLKERGIKLRLGQMLTGLEQTSQGTLQASFGNQQEEFDGVIMAIGGRPLSTLAADCGLKLNERGFIQVDEYMRTSDERIYALGDAVELNDPLTGGRSSMALAGPANKEARVLTADIARRYFNLDLKIGGYEGALGASAVKIFDLEASAVGLSERRLAALNLPHAAVWLHPNQHAGYYPGAQPCHVKVIYDPVTYQLWGAQAVGADAVKRIEVFSAYLKKKGSIDDLAFHEQVYAPPFSSARDPVNYAGSYLENIRDGLIKTARYDELESKFKEAFKLDVRSPEMFAARHIEGFVNIPLPKLRQSLSALPKDRPIVVTCVVGINAYNAARILLQSGFNEVYDLSGGVTTYFAATAKVCGD